MSQAKCMSIGNLTFSWLTKWITVRFYVGRLRLPENRKQALATLDARADLDLTKIHTALKNMVPPPVSDPLVNLCWRWVFLWNVQNSSLSLFAGSFRVSLLPPANEVWGKVMFLHLWFCSQRWGSRGPGGCLSGGSLSLLIVNIKLDPLWAHVGAMSLSLSHLN